MTLIMISFKHRSHSKMTSRMVLLFLPLLLAALSPCLVEGAWEDWNTGYGGVKWLFNCDFPGYDIGNQPSSGENCGRICIENSNCNHFSYHNGICYMKTVPIIHVPRSPANGGVCGFRPCHLAPQLEPVSKRKSGARFTHRYKKQHVWIALTSLLLRPPRLKHRSLFVDQPSSL
ncbi:Peroxinectin-like protein [Daphnia magna]|uniref:Peroxinectin-like protein n=1 Tax=Daphnia magna TaxID=35525 RepID=A0A164ZHL4_9CRUS|nr:Peroxinectin-like protein [Daphnia magna]